MRVTAVAVVGWIGGITHERCKKQYQVEAATLIPQSQVVPVEPAKGSSRTSQIMRFGFPSTDAIRVYGDYILSYDRRNRTANWVFEHLTEESIKRNDKVDRSKCEFTEDEGIHPFFRSQNTDYKRSGFDRGHLAAAGNHNLSQEYMNETFFLSNISPQVGKGFNRDAWKKLEEYVRNLTKTYKNVYVCTGPLYLPRREPDGKIYVKYEVIGNDNVAVPTHFFKVVVSETAERELHLESYIMPNKVISDNVPLSSFLVPIDRIERAAGLLFYDKLPSNVIKKINGKT